MDVSTKEAHGLLDFVNASPTRKFPFVKRERKVTKCFVAFHAVHWVKQRLLEAGFEEIQVCGSQQYHLATSH